MEDGERIKYTNQRVEILNFLQNNYSHPTVEDVYEGVRKKLTRISKATVYQNLKFLASKGLIQEVNIKGVSRFEPNINPHHHIICKNCGAIVDFESKELTEFSLQLIKNMKEFDIESTNTNFFGICNKCIK
ncbi:MAG: ferric uptake regulator [Candidatus Methanofastidiosum methylothiophilum]|jgi:Fur family ferric uptake transcriptional regulator|uniref:Ferric uptake regulator n=1 Tax=Candidatus Methanofastidiosum methylothiophilum TaxID=1705564 RepID=A0A150JFV4_9EURY|nr:MAG: ferric uptake regulator [Candidatus Methanofastidiosum methylthiophilus]MBP6931867.1 transcriptional repressor [Methanofastidiosum sp.]OQC49053.1 MAG: ferric uptake regulator [Euryarchaeota archaeon ADurb.Bin023]KYC56132.1 MAG: ferric uptake regulator [Candidatus Methanofastidiosum methylthiophilus]KYC56225.1 MAG: ferric uptake regulator [Candidatus Methanofastidiosum methylthiophilus]